jgi:undecaprenyl-diphosphatase
VGDGDLSLVEAIFLGVVQGVTEFLPISSTAHLRIAPELFHWADPGAAFSAIIQLGTVAAVIIYFWRDVARLAAAFLKGLLARKPMGTPDGRMAWFVIVGTIPVGIAGILFKKQIEHDLRSLYVIAASMILLAIVLFAAEVMGKRQRTMDEMTMRDGVVIGLCQAVALIPGSSRSGTTITGGLFLGLKREDAARYSFLLSIPANTAAGVFQLRQILHATERPSTAVLAVGTAVSFFVGLAAIAGLLRFLRTRSTMVFVVYRLLLGGTLLGLLLMGVLQPLS